MPKFQVTHTVLRAESFCVTVEAADETDALIRGQLLIGHVNPVEYEPGEVVGDHPDRPFEVHRLPADSQIEVDTLDTLCDEIY